MPLRRLSAAVAGVAVILLLSACGTGGSVVHASADKANGRKIFQTTCAGCHTLAAAGSSGTIGPNLDASFAEARAEGFNVINHANFNAPSGNLSSATFGRITSAGDPRILQFALKLHF